MRLRSLLLLVGLALAADEALARGGQNLELLLRLFNQAAKSADAPQTAPGVQGTKAPPEPDVVPLTVTETRFGMAGFSVSPPQAQGWFVRKPQGQGLWLLRPIDAPKAQDRPTVAAPPEEQKAEDRPAAGPKPDDRRTFAVTVMTTKIEAMPQTLEEFVKLRQARKVFTSARFKLLKHEESPEPRGEALCSRTTVTAEDYGPQGVEKLILEIRGIGCAHPEQHDWVVEVAYSERSANGGVTEHLAAEGEQVLSSLRFGPVTEAIKLSEALKALPNEPARLADVRQLAEQRYPLAQAVVGRYLTFGTDRVAPDRRQGFEWLKRAAQEGNAAAQFNLGVCYYRGIGVAVDLAEAKAWFARAQQQYYQNARRAMQEVDKLLAQRTQSAETDKKELPALQQAAAAGDPFSQFELATRLHQGRGLRPDMPEAVALYRKAAEAGSTMALAELATIYDYARGVPQDDAEALRWYTKAADQGSAPAQFNLFLMYRLGRGVARDDKAAREWLQKAADKGHPAAQTWIKRTDL